MQDYSLGLKYKKFTQSGCKNIRIRKLEFVFYCRSKPSFDVNFAIFNKKKGKYLIKLINKSF